MSWLGFAAIFGLFFVTHSVPVRPSIKSRIVAVLGPIGFAVSYSALSVGMLTILIWSAGQAPVVQLWAQMAWHRHLVHLGMLAVCLILAFAIARPNPFSFGGARNHAFDPTRPGIVRLRRHPILIALGLWAALHILPNGDLAHAVLFAVLGGFAVAGRALVDRRRRREIGPDAWDRLNTEVANGPYIHAPASVGGAALRLGAAVLAFVFLIWLHPIFIGVSAI
ncbi:NnrU family protein [Flavimaricola marinus]|uniref:NnrU protein n=1 Tax=Flavimaricola marinus TaxID=1819565 RepID=A0A238L9X7_9RHOB|nr:NnrU family protein [Flavimaricola marinus]SMY06373.1 NnrU protein [Flavimaricola marinus]